MSKKVAVIVFSLLSLLAYISFINIMWMNKNMECVHSVATDALSRQRPDIPEEDRKRFSDMRVRDCRAYYKFAYENRFFVIDNWWYYVKEEIQ